jgi:hypothetical protein
MIHRKSALRVEIPMTDSMACKTGHTTLMALVALTLSACASSYRPVNQEVTLRVSEGGERTEATCDVSNDRASWSVMAPATFGVTRSEKPLTVQCQTGDGSKATRVFDAIRYGDLPGSGIASYNYPPTLELVVVRDGEPQSVQVGAPAQIDEVSKLPRVGEDGREGYRRFLAGDSPRAFAISDKGRWVRVNAVRGAARLAMDRCQSYGGRCRLYAVDDQVVWDYKRAGDLAAAY